MQQSVETEINDSDCAIPSLTAKVIVKARMAVSDVKVLVHVNLPLYSSESLLMFPSVGKWLSFNQQIFYGGSVGGAILANHHIYFQSIHDNNYIDRFQFVIDLKYKMTIEKKTLLCSHNTTLKNIYIYD